MYKHTIINATHTFITIRKTDMNEGQIIIDDGKFYILLNVNYEPYDAPGFLLRRCEHSQTTPGGYECLGRFQKSADGKWSAEISAPVDDGTGSESQVLEKGVRRLSAISALWMGRTSAYSTHS